MPKGMVCERELLICWMQGALTRGAGGEACVQWVHLVGFIVELVTVGQILEYDIE